MAGLSVKAISKKDFLLFGTGFKFVKAITEADEIIKGGSLMLFKKQVFTIGIASKPWVDVNGQPFKFKVEGNVLFSGKFSLGIGSANKR